MHTLFNALSSEQRYAIIEHLIGQDDYTCICHFEDVIDRDRSVIYRHFKTLERAGLISLRKNGRRVEAKINDREKIERLLELTEEICKEEKK